MNRRSFFKSCGGAIAALMLPFGVKVKLSAPKKAKAVDYDLWIQLEPRFAAPKGLSGFWYRDDGALYFDRTAP